MPPLLDRFIQSFHKAISTEMAAMQKQLGPFEVPLAKGHLLEMDTPEQQKFYQFQILQPNDKLVANTECTLICGQRERLVTITAIDGAQVTLKSERTIDLSEPPFTLVIYPWFLYERLKSGLRSLLEQEGFFTENALMAFGQGANPRKTSQPIRLPHTSLNQSQQAAIQCCVDSNLSFIWGPPGTGKTTSLGHIVAELLAHGHRILVTSTTNAAVDQALAKLVDLPEMGTYLEQGLVIRVGQTGAETFQASLREVTQRLNAKMQQRLIHLRQRASQIDQQLDQCCLILDKLRTTLKPQQLNLFGAAETETITQQELRAIFSRPYTKRLLTLPAEVQHAIIINRKGRLETAKRLCRDLIAQYAQKLRQQEAGIIQQAQVILSTMTNMTISPLLSSERFDVVVVEEAGMAILPSLFYCAALARKKVILVGDPKQLPPIVQSKDEYVYRAMGRNIFDVTVPKPHLSEFVVMLDTQYRMHPAIGDMVSQLFYDGKLIHGPNTQERTIIAQKKPFPSAALVVIDTTNQTTCQTATGSYSRFNERTAQTCVDLAIEAVRDGVESVAIITPYAEQSRRIRQQLSQFPVEMAHIECRTVHRFQGGERDVVILDTVDTAPLSPGVLLAGRGPGSSAANLINVSISRARGKLIIVSDVTYFQQRSPHSMLNQVLQEAERQGMRRLLS